MTLEEPLAVTTCPPIPDTLGGSLNGPPGAWKSAAVTVQAGLSKALVCAVEAGDGVGCAAAAHGQRVLVVSRLTTIRVSSSVLRPPSPAATHGATVRLLVCEWLSISAI